MDKFHDDVDAAANGPDVAAASVLEPGGRWNDLIIAIGTYISGAELTRVSALDFANYQDTGVNWRVVEGYGTAIAAAGDGLSVALDCPVHRIDHSGQRLKIETAKGAITADRAIITLPSAVLAESERLFAPALPEKTQAARGLPLGLADKLFIALEGAEEFEPGSRLFGASDRSTIASYHLRPFGWPLIEAYFGGSHAAALEAEGEGAFFDSAVSELTGLLGSAFARRVKPVGIHPGASILSRAARILMRCPAKRDAARRLPLRSTTGCFLRARPARKTTSQPPMAAGSPGRPPRMQRLPPAANSKAPCDRSRTGPQNTQRSNATLRHSWPAPAHDAGKRRDEKQNNRHEEHDLGGFDRHAGNATEAK